LQYFFGNIFPLSPWLGAIASVLVGLKNRIIRNRFMSKCVVRGVRNEEWKQSCSSVGLGLAKSGNTGTQKVTQSKSLASFQAKYRPPFSFLLSGKVTRGQAGGAKRHLPLYMASKLWS
jgi:hypothetical protein